MSSVFNLQVRERRSSSSYPGTTIVSSTTSGVNRVAASSSLLKAGEPFPELLVFVDDALKEVFELRSCCELGDNGRSVEFY